MNAVGERNAGKPLVAFDEGALCNGRVLLYKIVLIREKSTRGKGKNIAFINTSGKYVLNRDFDDLYIDNTMYMLLSKYSHYFDKDVIINEMSRREIIENIGNWSYLNAGEDVELKARAVKNNIRIFGIPALIT